MLISIDIGASRVKGIVCDKKEYIHSFVLPTSYDVDTFLNLLKDKFSDFQLDSPIEGLVFAVPGQIDGNNEIIDIPNISWLNTETISRLNDLFQCKAVLINDAKAGAMYETRKNRLGNAKSGLFISCGTGLGGCYIYDGKPVFGANGAAGEFGHMIIDVNGEKCTCGRNGCWEAYASSRAFRSQLSIEMEGRAEYSREIFLKCVERTADYFLVGLSNLIMIFNPSVICFSGGFS